MTLTIRGSEPLGVLRLCSGPRPALPSLALAELGLGRQFSLEMTIAALSKGDYDEHLNKPHNPPDASISGTAFESEYDILFDQVASIMEEYGENNAYGDGDYCLEQSIANSRGLGFVIVNASIVTEQLLLRLQRLLVQSAPEWELFLQSIQFEFGIFIGPAAIRMYRESDEVLSQLNNIVVNVD